LGFLAILAHIAVLAMLLDLVLVKAFPTWIAGPNFTGLHMHRGVFDG
jgi:hypothetical protein